jgi:hypothetical protein
VPERAFPSPGPRTYHVREWETEERGRRRREGRRVWEEEELGSAESKPRQGGVWRHGRGGRRELLLPAAAVAPPLAIARPYSFGGLRRVAARYWSPPARCALPWAPRPLPRSRPASAPEDYPADGTVRWSAARRVKTSGHRATSGRGSGTGSHVRLCCASAASMEMEQRLKLRFFVSQPDPSGQTPNNFVFAFNLHVSVRLCNLV